MYVCMYVCMYVSMYVRKFGLCVCVRERERVQLREKVLQHFLYVGLEVNLDFSCHAGQRYWIRWQTARRTSKKKTTPDEKQCCHKSCSLCYSTPTCPHNGARNIKASSTKYTRGECYHHQEIGILAVSTASTFWKMAVQHTYPWLSTKHRKHMVMITCHFCQILLCWSTSAFTFTNTDQICRGKKNVTICLSQKGGIPFPSPCGQTTYRASSSTTLATKSAPVACDPSSQHSMKSRKMYQSR